MDWRNRKYYCVSLHPSSYEMRREYLKLIDGVKLHPYKDIPKQPTEQEERGRYQFLVSVPFDAVDVLEFELRKAQRRDYWCNWKEIKQDTSKKYFDVFGNEMPYRRCEMNPQKRCHHCMNC